MTANALCHLVPTLVLLIIGITGCDSGRPKTIPISGLVRIDGQPPGETGKLFFTPTKAADGYAMRPASGSFDAEGHYRVMSWAPDDGLVPAHYTVSVLPSEPDKSRIPAKYRQSSTSGLEVEVSADQRKIEFNAEVRTK